MPRLKVTRLTRDKIDSLNLVQSTYNTLVDELYEVYAKAGTMSPGKLKAHLMELATAAGHLEAAANNISG